MIPVRIKHLVNNMSCFDGTQLTGAPGERRAAGHTQGTHRLEISHRSIMITEENQTYPADVGNPEPVCEVSGSTASLAVSSPGTAGVQPATEQPSARCRPTPAGKPGTDCYEANAT
ncbi:unnamed protein product [Pleuronectes platessa]|uniref:Uncharacterized protein n=1 Tax=Pleuronectes platessa TaxID=8262 RepID=A0A9N7VUI3_PLEPL|nr:unnamed protein product [Pleuronectes platessa]